MDNARLAPLALWTTYLVWVATQIWIGRRDQRPLDGSASDRGSRLGIMVGMATGVLVASACPRLAPAAAITRNAPEMLLLIGLVVAWSGFAFHLWAVRTLGRYFRTIVLIQETHELVAAGPYRFLANPSYTGGLLSLVGMGLMLNNWCSPLAAVLLPLPAFVYRVHVEAVALRETFGAQYDRYSAARWVLVPGVW